MTLILFTGSFDPSRSRCHHVIDYRSEDFVARTLEITAGKGVAVVYDAVGKDVFVPSLDCLRPLGMAINYGTDSGDVEGFDLQRLHAKSLIVSRPTLRTFIADPGDLQRAAAALFDVVREGKLRLEINRRYPTDPYQRALMRNFVCWTDEKSLPHLLILNWSIALQPGASQWSDAQLKERLDRIPTAERRETWIRIARQPYSGEEKRTALEKLLRLLDKMEQMLSDACWLVDGTYSLADIAAVPFIARSAELAPDALADAPRVTDWWQRVQQRPAYALAHIERFDAAPKMRAVAI